MRWVYIFVGVYFFLLLILIVIGVGKIISLLTGFESWNYLKDFIEIGSWVATVVGGYGVLLAARAYKDGEEDKKLVKLDKLLIDLKELLLDCNSLIDRRSEIVFSFLKFDRAVSGVSHENSFAYRNDLAAFCKSTLRKIQLKHIFKIPPTVDCSITAPPGMSPKYFRDEILPKVGAIFCRSELFCNNLLHVEDSAFEVMNYIIRWANREAYIDYTYVDREGGRYWKNDNDYFGSPDVIKLKGDQDLFSYIHFEAVPAAILYFYCFGRDRLTIIEGAES